MPRNAAGGPSIDSRRWSGAIASEREQHEAAAALEAGNAVGKRDGVPREARLHVARRAGLFRPARAWRRWFSS